MDPFFLSIRIVVGTACVASVGGACLIILTFLAFKELRTLARQQLVNLSVADILVAGSHLLGLAALRVENYDPWTDMDEGSNHTNSTPAGNSTDVLCRVQASFTMFGTIASFLWSLALGFYMLMIIVLRRPDIARYLLVLYYPVCWLIPLALTLWFALAKPTYLGYSKSDIGWCYGRPIPGDHTKSILGYLLGYGLWFAITIVALVIIYSTMLCYLKFRNIRRAENKRSTDFKLVLIPLIFFLLRFWSVVLDIDTFDILPHHYYNKSGTRALILLAVRHWRFCAGTGQCCAVLCLHQTGQGETEEVSPLLSLLLLPQYLLSFASAMAEQLCYEFRSGSKSRDYDAARE
jgi:G protein-coupled receptor 157